MVVQILGIVFGNFLVGAFIALIFFAFENLEFCKLLRFVGDEAEEVFIGESNDIFRKIFGFIFYISLVPILAILYLLFFAVRFVFFVVMKFPWRIAVETYRHIKYERKRKK